MAVAKLKEPVGNEPPRGSPGLTGYDQDFYTWTIEQAAALRAGQLADLDIDHLAEEIEDLGKEVFSKLRGSFRVILTHMLKWDHQPERRSRSWTTSIAVHRIDIEDVLTENPALRRRQDEAVAQAYRWARTKAAGEMKRRKETLPAACPYTLEDILTRDFEWPDA